MKNRKKLLEQYNAIVLKSRSLARIRARRITAGVALVSRLSPFGGAVLWISLLLLSSILIVVLWSLHARWSSVIIIGLGTFINYIFTLLNIPPLYADYLRLAKKFSSTITDDQWGTFFADIIANRITIQILLPLLILMVVISTILSTKLGLLILFGLTMLTLTTSTYVNFGFSRVNIRDFGNLFSALIGKQNALNRNTEDLVQAIMDETIADTTDQQDLEVYIRLSENDLHKTQVDLETINFRLAIFAVIISILLTQQILDLVTKIFLIVNKFLFTFSDVSGQILGFSGFYKEVFTTWIYILLCWYLINIFLILFYQSSSALMFLYFNDYRAAYALQQALLLSSYEQNDKRMKDQPQKRKNKRLQE